MVTALPFTYVVSANDQRLAAFYYSYDAHEFFANLVKHNRREVSCKLLNVVTGKALVEPGTNP